MNRSAPTLNRPRWRVGTVAAATALLLGATACSSDDSEPTDAGSRASDGASPSGGVPSDEAPATGGSNATDDGVDPSSVPAVPEGPEGAGAGWVMADQLDTNAPVDSASLPDGVTVEQVADARQAWNDREAQLDGSVAPCRAVGAVWIAVTDRGGDTDEIVIGAQEGKAASCDAAPLMSVDADSNTVLTGAEFAALL